VAAAAAAAQFNKQEQGAVVPSVLVQAVQHVDGCSAAVLQVAAAAAAAQHKHSRIVLSQSQSNRLSKHNHGHIHKTHEQPCGTGSTAIYAQEIKLRL
jgi:hypothetical protein